MRTSLLTALKDRLLQGVAAAERRGASAARIGFGHGESVDCEFESGRLKRAGSEEDAGYTVTVVVQGRCGVTSGNRIEDVELMVERAVALAKAGSVAHFERYPEPAPCTRVAQHSPSVLGLTRERMIEVCGGMVTRLKQVDGDLDIHAGCARSEREELVVTNGGLCHETRSTGWSLGAGVQRTDGTDMLFAQAVRGWREVNPFFDPEYITGEIEADLRRGARHATAPEGEVPVYLPPEVVAMLGWQILGGLNGRNVAKGTSPLRDHLGEAYFAPNLTLVDRPHLDFCPGAAEIDSAGIPTQPCTLIERGVIRMFLYDLDTAGLAGKQPTGHSGCSPYSPELLPGDRPSAELLAGIEDGLYVKALLGFGQSNIANGDFSCNVALGYRIRHGELVGRVTNTMVAGNLFEIFRRDVALSSDRDPVLRIPHAVVRGLAVHSSAG
jgi:PmbA protein